jgi:hypothetical protein
MWLIAGQRLQDLTVYPCFKRPVLNDAALYSKMSTKMFGKTITYRFFTYLIHRGMFQKLKIITRLDLQPPLCLWRGHRFTVK